jgi:hypothetical protein
MGAIQRLHERLFPEETKRSSERPSWSNKYHGLSVRVIGDQELQNRLEDAIPYYWEAHDALGSLGHLIDDIETALICAERFMLEAGRLAPPKEIRKPADFSVDPDEREEEIFAEFTVFIPFRTSAEYSRYFLQDTMIRMHAFVERTYHAAGLIIGAPASKKEMLKQQYRLLNTSWRTHPIRAALDGLWHLKPYKTWVQNTRNAWTHEIDYYVDNYYPASIYTDLRTLFPHFVALYELCWKELTEAAELAVVNSAEAPEIGEPTDNQE